MEGSESKTALHFSNMIIREAEATKVGVFNISFVFAFFLFLGISCPEIRFAFLKSFLGLYNLNIHYTVG